MSNQDTKKSVELREKKHVRVTGIDPETIKLPQGFYLQFSAGGALDNDDLPWTLRTPSDEILGRGATALEAVKVYNANKPKEDAIHQHLRDSKPHDENSPIGAAFPTDSEVSIPEYRNPCGIRFDLLDAAWLEGQARIMAEGATKYGDNNWKTGLTGENSGLNHALKHLIRAMSMPAGPERRRQLDKVGVNCMFERYFDAKAVPDVK